MNHKTILIALLAAPLMWACDQPASTDSAAETSQPSQSTAPPPSAYPEQSETGQGGPEYAPMPEGGAPAATEEAPTGETPSAPGTPTN